MTKELLTRVYQGIRNYDGTDKKLAEDFLRANIFSTLNNAFRLDPISGWHVLDIDDFDGSSIHFFETEEKAKNKVEQLYGSCSDEFLSLMCYAGDIGYNAKAGKKNPGINIDENDATEKLMEKGVSNITATLTKIKNSQKGELETGLIEVFNPSTLEEAKNKRIDLIKKLGSRRGDEISKLLIRDRVNTRLKTEPEWIDESSSPYPSFEDMALKISKPAFDYSTLLALDRFLSVSLESPIAYVLAKVHPILAESYGEYTTIRPIIGGEGSGPIGRTLNSNLKEVMSDMAIKGFDMQPIFDDSGKCIASVRLQDVAGFITSPRGMNISDDTKIKYLEDCNLLLPPPPQLGGETDLSIAAAMLQHGAEAVLVYFDPNNWFSDKRKLEETQKVLNPGLHIMTSHDVVAFQLMCKH